MIELYEHQLKALPKIHNGSILCGGVGTGKSRTALAYYYIFVGKGLLAINGCGKTTKLQTPKDLYIITTAKKRDTGEWLKECSVFLLSSNPENSVSNVKVVVDSWNNIKKYTKIVGAFFIFDEQRVVGSGAWVKAFLNITRKNKWILLSATPGDSWTDYIPVFIANGFYKNKTEFVARHVVYQRFAKYPKIDRFVDTDILKHYRNRILVPMKYERKTVRHNENVFVTYDKALYKTVWRDRWDPYENQPIQETGKLFYLLRRVVNEDQERIEAVRDILGKHDKVIVFYNFTYELNALRKLFAEEGYDVGEWNGEVHTDVPTSERWGYLVQYSAGCEGWNCVSTNAMIFYSLSYSYRMTAQAEGRIDRLNTAFTDLWYYFLKSKSPIDLAISRALANKKNFNERAFLKQ